MLMSFNITYSKPIDIDGSSGISGHVDIGTGIKMYELLLSIDKVFFVEPLNNDIDPDG